MFGPSKIMKWFDRHLQNVRRSRRKTLAHMVAAAMKMKGVGVLALGRAMDGPALAKHRIKRVDRFLANEKMETFGISKNLFNILRGQDSNPIVLVDWTDRHAYEQLVLSIPRDGRSMPFYAITVKSAKAVQRPLARDMVLTIPKKKKNFGFECFLDYQSLSSR